MNDDKAKAVTLLKTAKGQLEGIIKMIEDGRYCIDISNQLMASTSLLKKAQKHILKQHLDHCVMHAVMSSDKSDAEEKTKEINDIIAKILDGK